MSNETDPGPGRADHDTSGIDLLSIERAAVRGWPALETAAIDGWLVRASSGGSVRANSVAALAFDGHDLGAGIDAVAAFYRTRAMPPRFTISDVSVPAGLDAALARRGWQRHGEHVTMAKLVSTDLADQASPPATMTVRHQDRPSPEWVRVYLEGLSQDRRAAAPELVERVPPPCRFFSAVRDGEVIGSGLSVHDGRLASVQCMATWPATRRSGAARAILAAIEAYAREQGAQRLYLQTDIANTPAMTLYARAGFTIAGRYHTRWLPN